MFKISFLALQLQMNLMQYDYIPPVDIKTEPYIPETGTLSSQTIIIFTSGVLNVKIINI